MMPIKPPYIRGSDRLPTTLHLGCGLKKYPGALGIDVTGSSKADLLWDLNCLPWPLPDNQFRKVFLIDILEHLDGIIRVMEEVYRVCSRGAEVIIQAPFASSHYLWTDPTHRRGFTSRSFKYFTAEFCQQHFEYTEARFQIMEVNYQLFGAKWFDRMLLAVANRRKFLYEKRFMYWFPAENIYFRLQALK